MRRHKITVKIATRGVILIAMDLLSLSFSRVCGARARAEFVCSRAFNEVVISGASAGDFSRLIIYGRCADSLRGTRTIARCDFNSVGRL